jgi:small subunit ribosomal protein S4e
MSRHLKRLAAPKIWQIQRKKFKFVTKPVPGPHGTEAGISLGTLLKETLNYASSNRESRKIINTNEVRIDGKIRKDFRFPVGVFDTIGFSTTNEHFRAIISRKGNMELVKIKKEEAAIKPCKIIGKTMINGKLQLNLFDGNNIPAGRGSYKVGDTILLSVPEKKIEKHLKLDKKASIFLIGGKHIGETGNVEDVLGDRIVYKNNEGELIETSRKYAFVIGENRPLITISEK